MKKMLGVVVLAQAMMGTASAGQVFKIKGKLKSYSDKHVTIIDNQGKKHRLPMSRLVLPAGQDLSPLLDKEVEYLTAPAISPDAAKDAQL